MVGDGVESGQVAPAVTSNSCLRYALGSFSTTLAMPRRFALMRFSFLCVACRLLLSSLNSLAMFRRSNAIASFWLSMWLGVLSLVDTCRFPYGFTYSFA
jgi:hypothetical protein